jgi:hypothetical protein
MTPETHDAILAEIACPNEYKHAEESEIAVTYITDESRALCSDPDFAIGYAKSALGAAEAALKSWSPNSKWALENIQTALEALNAVSAARERKFTAPF